MKKNRNKGITLIALVITIIILLVLAGISIASLIGSGVFERAKESKEKSEQAQIKEEIEMVIMDIQVEEISKGNNVTLELLEKVLPNKLKDIETELSNEKIDGTYKGYIYTIDKNLKVTINNQMTEEEEKRLSIKASYTFLKLPTNENDMNAKINLKINSKNLITNITYPDGTSFENNDERQEIEQELNVTLNTEYIIKCTLSDNSIVNKKITIPISELLITKMINNTTNDKSETIANITSDTYFSQEYLPYYAFDRNITTSWCTEANAVFPQNLYYEFTDGKKRKVENVQFTTDFIAHHNAYDVQVYGTNDDINWFPIIERTTLPLKYGENYTVLNGLSNESFKKFKFTCYNYSFSVYADAAIWDVQMYGKVVN